jgi:hypothetical protein
MILFENGKEKMRLPSVSGAGEVNACTFDSKTVRGAFKI